MPTKHWPELIRAAGNEEDRWMLFAVLADRMALTVDMAPGQVFAFEECDELSQGAQLMVSATICHLSNN